MSEPIQLHPARYVESDLPEFVVNYEIKGQLVLRARTAADAYAASLLYTKEQLGRQGDLDMDEPTPRALAPRSGVLSQLPGGREA